MSAIGPRATALAQTWVDVAATLDEPHRTRFLRRGLYESAAHARLARAADDLAAAVDYHAELTRRAS